MSLLVFDSTELYAPMAHVSPWLDMNTRPLGDVVAELKAQTHRRFIKSHLDYDLLPHDDRVTYITVGRDPRDVAISMANHMDNIDFGNFITERMTAVGLDDLEGMEPPEFPDPNATMHDRFWRWMDHADGDDGLPAFVNHLRSYRDRHHQANVVLLHYSDLQRDLVGQMQYLAARLGIERSRERLVQLAPAAAFETMKASAAETAPNGDQTFWKNTSDFFRAGKTGQWRDVIAEDELPRYDKRLAELVDTEFADWLHNGTLS